jgi:hypothetical protein
MADVQPSTKDAFFSPKNESMLQTLLYKDMQRRTGGDLTEKQSMRLQKTIHHYMGEVYYNPANGEKDVRALNGEVLRATVDDFKTYLGRNESQARPTAGDPAMDRIRQDVTSRFDIMQTERQETKALPAPPKFQIDLEDNGASSLSMFEQLKRQREEEAQRLEETAAAGKAAAAAAAAAVMAIDKPMPDDMRRRLQADDDFRGGRADADAVTNSALAVRAAARVAGIETARGQLMPVPPDGRSILFGEGGALGPRTNGIATANPTLALPEAIRTRPVLPQDFIKPQNDVITYKENEYNLFVYSADRDWVTNTTENRYNFSVNFDPANNRPGFGPSPAANIKFKNITRIELIKVIMPTEACETLTTKTAATTYETDFSINAFSYPYLQVRIDELNTNGYGTNDGLNNAFGVISYDAYWASDSALKNRGWTRMIPKFLKCQKVYTPTPLATLNKLTIQIQKPDGTLFCDGADALDVSGVVTSAQITNGGSAFGWESASTINTANTYYTDASGEFLWIQTKKWFSQFGVTQGDRIVMKNLVFPSTFSGYGTLAANDFLSFLTRPEGHVVVDIAQAYKVGSDLRFRDGSNKLGYSNFIIIRNNFADPTTGATGLTPWGGSSSTNSTFLTALAGASPGGPGFTVGRLLNLSHQIQVIFRVITRDMDSATRLRPDNL